MDRQTARLNELTRALALTAETRPRAREAVARSMMSDELRCEIRDGKLQK